MVLHNTSIAIISNMLRNHPSSPEQLECLPPSFLGPAFLRKPCLLSKPTEAEVAIKCEPVTIAVELILVPDAGTFYAG